METRSRIVLEGPVEAKVSADLPPLGPNGPLREIPLLASSDIYAKKIALIEIDGLLLYQDSPGLLQQPESTVARFRESLDRIAEDPNVHAVLLRINSPGGSVAAAEQMAADLNRLRKMRSLLIYVYASELLTGGSYYLAAHADRIQVNPACLVGGMGVILNLYNLRDVMAQFNIIAQDIKAGNSTDQISIQKNLSAEAKQWLQSIANEFHGNLVVGVQQQRKQINLDEGKTLDGRIFSPKEAITRQLIDSVGSLDDCLEMLKSELNTNSVSLIVYRRSKEEARTVLDSVHQPGTSHLLGGLPSIPGLDRSKLPTFLSIWQPDPTQSP